MSRFKRLEPILIYDDDCITAMMRSFEETAPRFEKEGWYLDRLLDESWYEIQTESGLRAFKDKNTKQFKLSVITELHRPLADEEVMAIRIILRYRKRYKGLRELLYIDSHWKQLRSIRREAHKYLTRIIKK